MQLDDLTRTQLAENLRFYGDSRFKQLTLFIGGLTVIAAGMAHQPDVLVACAITFRMALSVAGMLFTAVMWVIEVRAAVCWWTIWHHVPELWPRPRTPYFSWLTATHAVALLKVVSYFAFWCCALAWGVNCIALAALGTLGALLLAFTVVTYSHVGGKNVPQR